MLYEEYLSGVVQEFQESGRGIEDNSGLTDNIVDIVNEMKTI